MSRVSSHRIPVAVAYIALLGAVALTAGCTALQRRDVETERVLVHVVEPGETVERLADDYYGDARREREIRRFNDLDREEPIEAGTQLRIPVTPADLETLQRRRAARVPYSEGRDLAQKGSFLDASTRFREAVELDPRFAEAYFNLGVTYQRIKAWERSLEELEAAIKLRPENPDYRFALGSTLFYMESYDRAVPEFRKALDLDPFHAKARFSLAVSYEKAGRVADAKREWRRYLEVDDESEWADQAREHLEKLDSR
jgi:tetratricopeptide (TPR) repeat protein